MDSRERTLLALNHETPDRIPVDFWASAGFKQRIRSELGLSFEEFLDARDVDLRYIEGPDYVGPPLERRSGTLWRDIWGVPRRTVTLEVRGHLEQYREVVGPPLQEAKNVEQVAEYQHWPSPDWFDYSVVEAQCERIRAEGRAVVFMGDRLNRVAQLKPAMYLRGVDVILLDMALRPEMARAIFERIRDFYLEYLGRILQASNGKIDIVLTGDDFGSQDGPLISPAMWDQYLKDGFRQYVALAKAYGALVMHHTCGGVEPLIERMIECGLDVLQSLQPEARGMDPAVLKERYGDRLSFHGGVSIQKTMPWGTPVEVSEEVRRLAGTLGRGGGYIFCTAHNVQADTPMANVDALFGAYRRHGAYRQASGDGG